MIPKQMPKYKVVKCPVRNCGKIQITTSKVAMQCKFCGRRSLLRKNAAWNVTVYHMTESADLARRILIKLTNKQARKDKAAVVPNLRNHDSEPLTFNLRLK